MHARQHHAGSTVSPEQEVLQRQVETATHKLHVS
jgi:hypothetical protein